MGIEEFSTSKARMAIADGLNPYTNPLLEVTHVIYMCVWVKRERERGGGLLGVRMTTIVVSKPFSVEKETAIVRKYWPPQTCFQMIFTMKYCTYDKCT